MQECRMSGNLSVKPVNPHRKMKKFIVIMMAIFGLLICKNVAAEESAETVRHFWVPDEINRPIDNTAYRAAIDHYVKGYFYGKQDQRDYIIWTYFFMFNSDQYIEAFRDFKYDDPSENPVSQFEYTRTDGKIGLNDSITWESTIYILTVLDEKYGYDELATGMIWTTYFDGNGDVIWWERPAKRDEMLRMFAGMKIRSQNCGQAAKTTLAEYEARKQDSNRISGNTNANGSDPYVMNAGGANGATMRVMNPDSLNLGGYTLVLYQPINVNGGDGGSVVNSGNSGTTPAADQGSFRETTHQDVVNHGYDNVPYVYNARYYQWQEPGQQPQYVYRSNGQWLYAAGGFAVGVVVGALLDNLFTTCNNNNATGCGYGYNGSGGVVVNNYNYNNNTVNTGGNPSPNPNPNTGGPVTVENGTPGTGGRPTGVENGSPQSGGNRNQGYVYSPQGNVQGNPPPRTQQANQGGRPNQQQVQPAPTQSRGNVVVTPAPRPSGSVQPAPRAASPAPSPAPAPGVQARR